MRGNPPPPRTRNLAVQAHPETSFSKSDKERMLLSAETRLGLRITGIVTCDSITVVIQQKIPALSFVGLVKMMFSLPEVKGKKLSLLSGHFAKTLWRITSGARCNEGARMSTPIPTNSTRMPLEVIRIVNSFCCAPVRGNCRGSKRMLPMDSVSCQPLQNDPGRSDIGAYYSICTMSIV